MIGFKFADQNVENNDTRCSSPNFVVLYVIGCLNINYINYIFTHHRDGCRKPCGWANVQKREGLNL